MKKWKVLFIVAVCLLCVAIFYGLGTTSVIINVKDEHNQLHEDYDNLKIEYEKLDNLYDDYVKMVDNWDFKQEIVFSAWAKTISEDGVAVGINDVVIVKLPHITIGDDIVSVADEMSSLATIIKLSEYKSCLVLFVDEGVCRFGMIASRAGELYSFTPNAN